VVCEKLSKAGSAWSPTAVVWLIHIIEHVLDADDGGCRRMGVSAERSIWYSLLHSALRLMSIVLRTWIVFQPGRSPNKLQFQAQRETTLFTGRWRELNVLATDSVVDCNVPFTSPISRPVYVRRVAKANKLPFYHGRSHLLDVNFQASRVWKIWDDKDIRAA
jgi:hypothetical protein